MAHEVFISYAFADRTAAEALCAALEHEGISCWMAPRDVAGGQHWPAAIVQAIASSRALVLLLSAQANASSQVAREVERATSHGVPVLPLRLEEVAPAGALEYFLAGVQWADVFGRSIAASGATVAEHVRRAMAGAATPASAAAARFDPGGANWWSALRTVMLEPFLPEPGETLGNAFVASYAGDRIWRAEYAGRGMRLSNEADPSAGSYNALRLDEPDDTPVSVDVRIERAGGPGFCGAGLLYRLGAGAEHYAYLLCADDSVALIKSDSARKRYAMLANRRPRAFRPGALNRLAMVGRGASFWLMLNDECVAQVSDPDEPLLHGSPGIVVKGMGAFEFANLAVYSAPLQQSLTSPPGL